MLWLQGYDAAPPLVKTCVESWERNNPDWSVRLLTESSVKEYLDPEFCKDLFSAGLPFSKIANIIRLELVARHGGVWADADCFCTEPLDGWIHEAAESGFFAFRFDETERWLFDASVPAWKRLFARTGDRVMANWFVAGKPDNLIATSFSRRHFVLLKAALKHRKESVGFIRNSIIGLARRNVYLSSQMGTVGFVTRLGRYPYFIFHYHFANLLRTDPDFRQAWEKVEMRSAPAALKFSKKLGLPVDQAFQNEVKGGFSPVYKFHWRRTTPLQTGAQTRFEWLQAHYDGT
jgi:hypothetical protein